MHGTAGAAYLARAGETSSSCIRFRVSRPALDILCILSTHSVKSNPSVSFSSFASSRQASVSDLLPSPAALATCAHGEGGPPHAVAASRQLRLLLLSSIAPSPLGITPCRVGFPSAPNSRHRSSASRCSRFGFPSAPHSPSSRHHSSGLSSTPPRPRLRRVPVKSSSRGGRLRGRQPTSPLQCPRRRHVGVRMPRRPTSPPLQSNSRRFRVIQSRPDPVKWSSRRVTLSRCLSTIDTQTHTCVVSRKRDSKSVTTLKNNSLIDQYTRTKSTSHAHKVFT
jgi:hypothetical protein